MRSSGRPVLRLGQYGSLVGHLLLRSMARADRVYRSMVARGFDGEVRLLRVQTWGGGEWVFLISCLGFFAAARTWNLAEVLAWTSGRIGP